MIIILLRKNKGLLMLMLELSNTQVRRPIDCGDTLIILANYIPWLWILLVKTLRARSRSGSLT